MSKYTPPPGAPPHLSPKEWHQTAREQSCLIDDAAQSAAIEELDLLWQQLVDFKRKRKRFLGRSLRRPQVPIGLYFWGGVGRGKSFLMDSFYACVPYRCKRRVHFHNFMAEVHHELRALAGRQDPLLAYASRLAQNTRLLCFDEFHISDIADAMILGRLLSALLELGVVLVTTSNYPPDGLYPDGLQRQNFLPTIDLIKRKLKVLHVDGGQDYRLREMTKEPMFMVPATTANEKKMAYLFQLVSDGVEQKKRFIEILGRKIPVKRVALKAIWFDFMALCNTPRAQTDYLEIAREYNTVFISDIPKMTSCEASIARRFTWLIDVFYDNRVRLIASAATHPEQLYTQGQQANEFSRTASRLIEMQSRSYLEVLHRSKQQAHNQTPKSLVL